MSEATDKVQVELTREQAFLVRGALMAYRSAIDNVVADLGPDRPDTNKIIRVLIEAKLAVENVLVSSEEDR